MPPSRIERIRTHIRQRQYDMSAHAMEEMAEDDLDIEDVERSVLTGEYGYSCEQCDGFVRPKRVEREAFKHKKGFVILENVVVGICDRCGNRYYSADILHTVHEIATGRRSAERMESIPVVHLASALAA